MSAVRVGAAAVIAAVLAVVQAASLALFGSLAPPGSVPHALTSTWPVALARRLGLDELPPIRREIARAALTRGDLAAATGALVGLPPSNDADDLRGRLAELRGDDLAAVASYARAQDGARARALIRATALRDRTRAAALALRFLTDLRRRGATDPVLGEAAWRAGTLVDADAAASPAERRRLALTLFSDAVREDPEQETYWLSLGFTTLANGDARASRDAYLQARLHAPNGVDAAVGFAVASAALGDCPSARASLARANALAARARTTADPRAAGFSPSAIAALQRCP